MRQVGFISILILTCLALNAAAQDSHYWDNQYGTKGELLGGVVVGSPSDLSATFYNPGWISLHDDPSLLNTTFAAEGYAIKLTDGLGEGTEPTSSTVTTSPGFLAGRFSMGRDDGWQWAYSYLQKVKFQFDATGIRVDPRPTPPTGGPAWLSGEAFRKARADEYWYGATFSRKIRPNAGLGFSPYVVYRSMKSRVQTSAQYMNDAADFAQIFSTDEYEFWHVRLLLKTGLAVEKGNMTYGLTLTTPSLGIMGSGRVYTSSNFSGVDQDQDGSVDDPYLSANSQEDLSATWVSPLSVAAGASWKAASTGIHLTLEWFNSVATRPAIEPEDFRTQSDPSEINSYNLSFGAQSVLNYGIGLDHAFTPKFSLYGAFRSDYSTIPSEQADNLQISNWDLWHISSGASFTFLDIEFTTGIQYSWGAGTSERFINFNLENNGEVTGDFGTHETSYNRLKVVLGFNLPFGETGK